VIRVLASAVAVVIAAPFVALAVANAWVLWRARGRVFADVYAVPARMYGLVPGTSRLSRAGYANRHFQARVQAAANAYRAGAVQRLVVSGGPSEVAELTEAVTALGVPPHAVIGDPAGLDTLATARWAGTRGIDSVVVIGQHWHLPRAIFLCRAIGVDAVGYAPPGVGLWTSVRHSLALRRRPVRLREWLARAKAAALVATGRTRHPALPPAPRVLADSRRS
jgi:SanA protein